MQKNIAANGRYNFVTSGFKWFPSLICPQHRHGQHTLRWRKGPTQIIALDTTCHEDTCALLFLQGTPVTSIDCPSKSTPVDGKPTTIRLHLAFRSCTPYTSTPPPVFTKRALAICLRVGLWGSLAFFTWWNKRQKIRFRNQLCLDNYQRPSKHRSNYKISQDNGQKLIAIGFNNNIYLNLFLRKNKLDVRRARHVSCYG